MWHSCKVRTEGDLELPHLARRNNELLMLNVSKSFVEIEGFSLPSEAIRQCKHTKKLKWNSSTRSRVLQRSIPNTNKSQFYKKLNDIMNWDNLK